MCGIIGLMETPSAALQGIIEEMSMAISHRGPDAQGTWTDPEIGLAFGHRRLSIVDLSPLGHQPMISASGRYVIVFNGEVYNYQAISKELEAKGHRFKGHSDTEVMLAAFEEWGVRPAVEKFIGMFAFGLWDKKERVLHLVRDRLGIKPLFYGWFAGRFGFSSELKALTAHPEFRAEIDRDSLALMMRYSYVPAPHTIYKGIFKLQPGWIVSLSLDELQPQRASSGARKTSKPDVYWSVKEAAQRGSAQPFKGGETECLEQLEHLLLDSIRLRMIADVPLGAFLSGGIDSSLVVALMQSQSSMPVRTFSIGFHEEEFNEAKHARRVAEHLKTNHTELYLTEKETLDVIPLLPVFYDEPFADASQIPTYLVSKLARQQVTVSLSGDGGDELFGGYTRYHWARKAWRHLKKFPGPLRAGAGVMLQLLPPRIWDAIYSPASALLPQSLHVRNAGDKAHKLGRVLRASSAEQLYARLVSHWEDPGALVLGSKPLLTAHEDVRQWPTSPLDYIQHMSFVDTITYLPDDILTKVDRASMGVSLEARVPLIDHRVVEFAWSLPVGLRMPEGRPKHLLRKLLYKHVPAEIIERPKMGFAIPIGKWLKTELRDWVESLIDEKLLKDQGFLNAGMVRTRWNEYLSGRHNWEYYLWDILMFQAWLREHG